MVFSSIRYAMHGLELITISYASPSMPRRYACTLPMNSCPFALPAVLRCSLLVLLEQIAEHRIDLLPMRRATHCKVRRELLHALVLGPQRGRAILRMRRGQLEIRVVAHRGQELLAQEACTA